MTLPESIEDISWDSNEDIINDEPEQVEPLPTEDVITDCELIEPEIVDENCTEEQENNIIEIDTPPPGKENYVKCQECGEWLGTISPTHLKMHNMTNKEYREKYPNVRMTFYKKYGNKYKDDPRFSLPPDVYVDNEGKTRNKHTGKLVKIKNQTLDSKNAMKNMEKYIKNNLTGFNGEILFIELMNIATYDQKKEKDKFAKYKPSDKLKAIEIILAYGFGRPVQRKEVDSTSKKLVVSIGKTLPKELDYEDF